MSTLYAGIDLHSNNNVVVVINEKGSVVHEKRLKNELGTVLSVLDNYKGDLGGSVVESTYNWYWLVDGLAAAGYKMHLANTGAIQQYSGLKHANDKSDARWLAEMLRLGILPEAYIYPAQWRPLRDLLRRRMFLSRQHTAQVLSIQNVLSRNTGRSLPADGVKRLDSEGVAELGLPEFVGLSIEASLEVARSIREEVKKLEKVIRGQLLPTSTFKNLKTVDGIGDILGSAVVLETGNIWRFPTVGNYASYARCVGGERVSNGKKKGKANTKNGNAYLSWAFSEAAQHAIRYNDRIRRFYQRKLSKGHVMVARRAVAHKLARACYYIQRDGEAFDDAKAFGGE